MVLKIPSAGGQVPTQTVAPASASARAMAQPKPPSSATPATSARLPDRSMLSTRASFHDDLLEVEPAGEVVGDRVGVAVDLDAAAVVALDRVGARLDLDAAADPGVGG